jgi:hypothetical protein
MSNLLDNGAVLPHGLLGHNSSTEMAGFNKTYKNYGLKVGVVVASYSINDSGNQTGLANEYDVVTMEQHENKGATTITYRNCLSAEGLGSIADFFEMTLRYQKHNSNVGPAQNTKGQDGAVVLLLCLNGVGEKAIIVGALTHPDRTTTLTSTSPHLEGEYNGVHVVVNEDGSTSLTFKGATNNDGSVVDSTQGNTELSIEKDGSYQVNHSTITQRFDRNGQASLTATDNISNTTQKNFSVTATDDIDLTATGDLNTNSNNLAMNAQGSALLACQKATINSQSDFNVTSSQTSIQAESLANIKAASIVLDGQVALGGQGGSPVLTTSSIILGIGNLGGPVISMAIAGFASKVTAQ